MVLQYPLHGYHQQILQLELAILDLKRALLVWESSGWMRGTLPGRTHLYFQPRREKDLSPGLSDF